MPLSLMNLFILPFTYHKASSGGISQVDSKWTSFVLFRNFHQICMWSQLAMDALGRNSRPGGGGA